MRCLCGYEYNFHYEKEEQRYRFVLDKGDEEFVKIVGNFTQEDEDGDLQKAHIIGCPKCHILQFSLEE